MMNLMKIDNINAVIKYDPEIEMFRGEFIGLNGGADFYAKDIESLKKEGAISLKVFLDACKKRNIEPKKKYSGKFNVRVPCKCSYGRREKLKSMDRRYFRRCC
jgi:predicted HicB family RNase H-like nuclease